jgi:hypothetical protein
MPHLDKHERIERAHAAELSASARDREANAARIRESIADGSAGVGGKPKSVHCGVCGSPFGDRTKDRNACADCQRRDWEDWARSKLGPEELHPEHFPEDGEDQ